MIETVADGPAGRWRFFTDEVMGGVSSGALHFDHDDDRNWARMTGMVSTANNGGFIQMQHRLDSPLPASVGGVRLVARGKDQRYYIHLRRSGASAPTEFYRAGFDVSSDWREVRLPWAVFTASNASTPPVLEAASIASVAIVAYGRNHCADIRLSAIGFYQSCNGEE